MAGTTSPDNIPYQTTGDGVIDTAYTVALAEAVQDALDSVRTTRAVQNFRWANAAARTAQTGMVAGDRGYQVDTATDYIYSGSAWRVDTGGLILVGSGSFSAVASRTVNTVFSSAFSDYLIVTRFDTSASADATLQLRVGASNAATNYNRQLLQSTAATASGALATAQTSVALLAATGAASQFAFDIRLSNPGTAVATAISTNINLARNTSSGAQWSGQHSVLHSTATAYDGFALAVSAGTMTGTYRVYGYA